MSWRDVTPREALEDDFRPRDGLLCGGRWVIGGSTSRGERTRPAAWVSSDLDTWQRLRFVSRELYARQSIVTTIACRDGEIAMLAEKSGGAHGLPRIRLWRETARGVMRSMTLSAELFGGPSAVSVNRLEGEPAGWLVTGARTDGAAVWSSRSARSFTLHHGRPDLATDHRGVTTAYDAAVLSRSRSADWLVVGALRAPGASSRPVAFSGSPAAGWTREALPTDDAFSTAERVVTSNGSAFAVGLSGDEFGTWIRTHGTWSRGPGFGGAAAAATAARYVSGLVAVDRSLWAAVSNGEAFEVWRMTDGSWTQVELPWTAPVSGDNVVTVAAGRGEVVALAFDGRRARVCAVPVA